LPDITKGKETEDRIAVLVSGNGIEELFGVPAAKNGTGMEIEMLLPLKLNEQRVVLYCRFVCLTRRNTKLLQMDNFALVLAHICGFTTANHKMAPIGDLSDRLTAPALAP
jgi:hypothetical protein